MTNVLNAKLTQETSPMKTEVLSNRIAAARLELSKALLIGSSTAKPRATLLTLLDEQANVQAQEQTQLADQQAAAAAANELQSRRINEGAQTLAEARHARLACLADRFRIPDRRDSTHA